MASGRSEALMARYRAALALERAGDAPGAAAALRRLLARHPAHAESLALLGVIEGRSGRPDAALALLQRAALLQPASAAVQNNLGNALATLGRDADALAAFDRSLALRPGHAPTLHNRARLLQRLGRLDEACAAADEVLRIDPARRDARRTRAGVLTALARVDAGDAARERAVAAWHDALAHGTDAEEARYALAALGAADVPRSAPRRYVEQLFDQYAPQFDEHLRSGLGYRTPELLVAEALGFVQPPLADVVDLGCGTGLCGPLLRPHAARLVGVDLSAAMIERARARGCYDRLVHADVVEHLRGAPAAYALAVAADVVNYVGDLHPLAEAAAAALVPGGVFAFSVERHDGDGCVLQPSRRFAHGLAHVRAAAEQAGLAVASITAGTLRHDAGEPVAGHFVVLRRRDDAPAP